MNSRKLATVFSYPFRKYVTCMFAITSRCNARCGFCSIPSQNDPAMPSYDEATNAIEQLHSLGVRYIQFTGGEPFLYPSLFPVIKHASDLGMLLTVVTNGSLLDEGRVRTLAESGVQSVSISVDHHSTQVLELNRGIPGLADRICEAVRLLRNLRIPVQASTTISHLLDLEAGDYEKLIEKNQAQGFDGTYFCYPMPSTRSNYSLGGEIARFAPERLAAVISHILALKRRGYTIDNSLETLNDVLAHLGDRPSRYPCVAGYKVFYLDWRLDLYDCMTNGRLIGPILKLDPSRVISKRTECDECILSCDREPSIYHHGVRSVAPFMRLVRDTAARVVPF